MPQVSMIPQPCRVVAAMPQNSRDVHYRVEVPARSFAPEPGQFVMISLPGIGEAPFSLTALPGEGAPPGHFELLIRRVGRLSNLLTRVKAGGVDEIVLATNPTMEGEGTALHIKSVLASMGVKITQLARGLPTGSQLEYASRAVLQDAIEGRREF